MNSITFKISHKTTNKYNIIVHSLLKIIVSVTKYTHTSPLADDQHIKMPNIFKSQLADKIYS